MSVRGLEKLSSEESLALEELVELSRGYGADRGLVLGGGGNTSVKFAGHLLVKGSGAALATVRPEDFVDLDRGLLQALLESELGGTRDQREAAFKEAVMAARLHPERNQRPSVESVLHQLMPGKFVVHLHSTLVNQFSCSRDGRSLVSRLDKDIIWVDLVDPGFVLAKALQAGLAEFVRETGKSRPRAVIMQNHGVVVSGDTPEGVKADIDWLIEALEGLKRQASEGAEVSAAVGGRAPLPSGDARALINIIGPALRGLLGRAGEPLPIVTYDGSREVVEVLARADAREIVMGGPLTPDQIVYCRSFPLWFESDPGQAPALVEAQLAAAVAEHTEEHQVPPIVVLVPGLGLFAAGSSWADANTARLVYVDSLKVMAGALSFGGAHYLPQDFREFIEHWEVESYRRAVAHTAASAGRAAGKVALVTGAAQGFGLEIAQDLADQGAHVALTDVNVAGVEKAAHDVQDERGEGKAVAFAIDVTSAASVAEAVHQVVRTYGGLDLLVVNAGVLRAAGVGEQAERDFDLTTAVNYKGYFLCVQAAAPVLATQHRARPDYWSDVIQVNSKSGLQGSNKNFAYAGSKFGGIGLTQSFALELVEDGIKVNSVCPGNFFDGPLWSDPEMGLFVQYLRAGKVPGAKTVADIRRSYENKVPMGRGCTAADVMKAVYYLIDQVYETGQALPVTGGQVMLH